MFKRKQLNIGLAVTAVLLASSAAVNAEVANDAATVTVQNAFTITSTTAIDFGILRVSQSGAHAQATPSRTVLEADGNQTAVGGDVAANGSMTLLQAGTPGRIDITNAAPFTILSVDLAVGGLDFAGAADAKAIAGINGVFLTTPGAGVDDKFIMSVNADDTRIEGGTNNTLAYDSVTPNLRTDGAGAVGLTFGGTLAWKFDSGATPTDSAYTGNYSITVNY